MQPIESAQPARLFSRLLDAVTAKSLRESYGKRIALCFFFATLVVLGGLWFGDRRYLHTEIERAEANLLNAFEFYAQFSRNVRSITQRYDMLIAGAGRDPIEEPSRETIESLMLQSSFALGQEYFFLRGVNGITRVEIRRGTVQSTQSELQIDGEEEFAKLSDVFLSRSCRINGVVHYCLIDIPNKREFVQQMLRTYSLVALTVREAVLYSRYKPSPSPWPLQSPSLFLRVADQKIQLSYGEGTPDFLTAERTLGSGVSIFGGYSRAAWLGSALLLSTLLTFIGMIVWRAIDRFYDGKMQRHTEVVVVQEKLRHFEETKLLVRGVVHDIKSPLGTLKALTEMEQKPESRRLLELLTKRMSLIVSDLERKENEAGAEGMPLLPLSQVLRLVLKEKTREFKDAVRVSLETPTKELWVRGEYSEVCRMFSNLLNNAREASRSGGHVWITISRAPAGSAEVRIRDEGKGMPKEVQHRIFENGVSFEKKDGTGYGLFHAKLTMEKMGGRMQVSSEPGVGTTFSLQIPVEPTPSWAVDSLSLDSYAKFLIIDDESFYREIWKERLAGKNISEFDHPRDVPVEALQCPDTFRIVDNHYGSDRHAGLRFLEAHGAARSILVTSDWASLDVQRAADRLGIRLLGKDFLDSIR